MRKIDEITAIAEWRLKMLHEKTEEARRERLRAEKAEARLAEVGAVVEAAERLAPHIRTMSVYMDGLSACCVAQQGVKILGELREALRAARWLREGGAGKGGVGT